MGMGETIQSYNHQNNRGEVNHNIRDSLEEDDNIDVVNDTDKDSGKKYINF